MYTTITIYGKGWWVISDAIDQPTFGRLFEMAKAERISTEEMLLNAAFYSKANLVNSVNEPVLSFNDWAQHHYYFSLDASSYISYAHNYKRYRYATDKLVNSGLLFPLFNTEIIEPPPLTRSLAHPFSIIHDLKGMLVTITVATAELVNLNWQLTNLSSSLGAEHFAGHLVGKDAMGAKKMRYAPKDVLVVGSIARWR